MPIWPWGRGLSLRLSLWLFLVLPLIAVLAIAGTLTLHHLERRIESRLQEDIKLIARALREPLAYSLERRRPGSVARILESAFRSGRVYGAYVYNRQGRQIAATGPRQPSTRVPRLARMAARGQDQGTYQQAHGDQVYSFFVPLSDSVGRNLGLLQITRAGSDFRQYIHQARYLGLGLLLLLGTLFTGVLVYGHHRLIGRNLQALVVSMGRIARGERSHRAALTGPWELRHLAEGMNSMLDSIEHSEQELEKQRQQQAYLQQQLQQSQKMAALGQLAAGVAHELGTPLSVVSGKAQRMLRRQELPEVAHKVFAEIQDAVQRMEGIVRQLMDFGRANPVRRRSLSLQRLAECALAQVGQEAGDKGVALETCGSAACPNLNMDALRLEQALVNLLRNAIQATSAGGRVRLVWFSEAMAVGWYVADTGPGVPPELRQRLFEPFFTTKDVGEGTGLGLAVAQAAVQDHNGRLEVSTDPELGGARFTLWFAPGENQLLQPEEAQA